jgi:hypothetical protein
MPSELTGQPEYHRPRSDERPPVDDEHLSQDPVSEQRARRWGRAFGVIIGMAAALAVALAVSLATSRADAVRLGLAGTELAPTAAATGEIHETAAGVSIRLDIHGLEPAPPGFYYQAWVGSDTAQVAIGTFRAGGEGIELWSGVELDDYPTLEVTIQQEGGGPASSGHVVLRGSVGN